MPLFAQLPVSIDGLMFGMQLALLAVGLTLIFGLGEVLNLAHGEFAVVSAIASGILIAGGTSSMLAILIGVLTAGLVGTFFAGLVHVSVYRAMGEIRILMSIFVTLGLSFVIDSYLAYKYALAEFSISSGMPPVTVYGMTFRPDSFLAGAIAALVLVILTLFLKYTTLGKAIRALAESEVGAQLCGISPSKLRFLVFILGAMMAGFAGIIIGFSSTVGPADGPSLTVYALIVAVVGGVRSVQGTILAGIMLGVVYELVSFNIGTYFALIIFLLAAAVTILLRPEGLLGVRA